ncbi:hypothetical protein OIU74_014243, partial [Salix koriyanagi]
MFELALKVGIFIEDKVNRTHMKFYHEQIVSMGQIWVQSRFVSLEYQKQAWHHYEHKVPKYGNPERGWPN